MFILQLATFRHLLEQRECPQARFLGMRSTSESSYLSLHSGDCPESLTDMEGKALAPGDAMHAQTKLASCERFFLLLLLQKGVWLPSLDSHTPFCNNDFLLNHECACNDA